jgi:integrase
MLTQQTICDRTETTTKSHKIRRVDMSHQLQATLKSVKELRQLEAMAEGRELAPWVFLAKGGQRWDDRHLRRVWVKCLEAAGLRHVRFHDLRHTYASELAEQGAPPKYVQSQLGHSSIQVTMDIYSHLFEKRNCEWVNKLDETTEEMNGYSCGGGESATQAQPGLVRGEHQTDKPLKYMVAVEGLEPPARGL